MSTQPSCKRVTEITLQSGTRVVVRGSLNVPIGNGHVTNDFRLRRMIPTLRYLVDAKAVVVLIGHLGDETASMEPVAEALSKLGFTVEFVATCVGPGAAEAVASAAPGTIVLLENLRQQSGEKENDQSFAKELASLGECYVNDAFAASHRSHASLVSLPALLPAYAGFNFIHECEALSAMRLPQSPSLFMLGGAKFETKLPLVEKFLDVYDHVFVGGALAHDFFKAKGYEIGKSLSSEVDLSDSALRHHAHILLPVDVVVTNGGASRVCAPEEVMKDDMIVDAGPETVALLAEKIRGAAHVLWNGPFGNYESGFAAATEEVAKELAIATAYSVVGGGDTIASIESLKLDEKYSFLSTAGGAMLTFLETGSLPALECLRKEA